MKAAILSDSATNDVGIADGERPNGLPGSWSYVPLRSVCEKTSIWNPAREPRDRFRYIDVSSVSNEHFRVTEAQEVAGSSAPSRARKIVKTGDVIYATVRPSLKRVAWIEPRYENEIASTAFCVLRADREQAVSRFLYYVLLSEDVNRKIIEHERGASYPAVTDKDVLNQLVPLPPIAEQEKIAAVLWKIQKAVEIEDAIARNTRDLKKSLLRRLFTNGLRGEPLKETEIGLLPESWRVCRFDEFCVLQRGFDITKKQQAPGTIPVISSGGISSFHDTAAVKGPGVVVGRKGSVGGVHFAQMDYWPHDTTLWVKDFKGNDVLFTYYFLHTLNLKQFDTGTSNPTLNRNLVHALNVGVPQRQEQREIAGILQTVDRKIEIRESKKRSLQDLFKTMLHKLMTAQIRVNDLDIDTSEVGG